MKIDNMTKLCNAHLQSINQCEAEIVSLEMTPKLII